MFSLRIVNVDHYLSIPIPGVDVTYSDFRCCRVKKVPVVRVFGSTPAGQKTCLHLHGVFPYICVPCDGSPLSSECEKELHQLAVSLDRALNVGLGKSSTTDAQHVYKVSLVSGIPFYGYHSKEQHFYKIYFYNPLMVKRAVELLQNGAVLNKAFQPHEAHVPFILQMFIDYNLYGMNLLNLASVKFRKKNESSPESENSCIEVPSDLISPSSESNANSFSVNSNSYSEVKFRKWTYDLIPDALFLPEDVHRQSVCELEVDALASDILNRMELMSNPGMNPGLKLIWEDEKQRRQRDGKDSQTKPAISQDRGEISLQTTELRYLQQLKNMLNQSDSPLDLSNNGSSICARPSRSQEIHTLKEKDKNPNIFSNKIETEAVVNEDLVLSLNQSSSNSQHGSSILDTQDEELIDILAKINSSQSSGDRDSILSTRTPIETWDQTEKQFDDIDELNDEDETKEMSQLIWETDPRIVTDMLPQVDGPVDPKQTHSGLNRTPRFRMPASQTHLSATSGMRLKTARKSTSYMGTTSTLHPIPSPVTNHQYRAASWPPQSMQPMQPMQPMPPVPQNFLYQNHQHSGPMHWNYNMWHHPMDMGSSAGFPGNSVGMEEQKKMMSSAPCWPNSAATGPPMVSNCREFSAMNPFSDGYPSVHYNRQERLPSLNMPSCLATPPGGFYEPHSFIPPINYNCEMTMPKYQQQQQQQAQQLMAAGNAFNCMESTMGGNQKNFIALQRFSYVSKDYQVSWPEELNRNEQDANYYNSQTDAIVMSENTMPVNVLTTCGDVLAAAMSSSGIDMHSLAEVCEEEEQCVEFTDGPLTTSACRVDESSVMVVAEREQRISAVTKRKTSVVACVPNSSEEGNNENWMHEPPVWLVGGKEPDKVQYQQEEEEEEEEEEEKNDQVENCLEVSEETTRHEGRRKEVRDKAEKVNGNAESIKGAASNENRKYVLPDLSSIIESEELLEEQGSGMDLQEKDDVEEDTASPNLQLSDISEEDIKEFEENVDVDEYQDNKVELPMNEECEVREEGNEFESKEVDVLEANMVDEEEEEEEMGDVILIELNENEELVLDLSDEKEGSGDSNSGSIRESVVGNDQLDNEEVESDKEGMNDDVEENEVGLKNNVIEKVPLDAFIEKVLTNSCGLEVLQEDGSSETSLNMKSGKHEVVKMYKIEQTATGWSEGFAKEKSEEKQKLMEKLEEKSKLIEKLEEKQNLTEKSEEKQNLTEKSEEKQNLEEKLEEKQNLEEKLEEKQNLAEKLEEKQNLAEKLEEKQNLAEKLEEKQNLAEKLEEKQNFAETLEEKQNLAEKLEEKQNSVERLNLLENSNNQSNLMEKSSDQANLMEKSNDKTRLMEKSNDKPNLMEKSNSNANLVERSSDKPNSMEKSNGNANLVERSSDKLNSMEKLNGNANLMHKSRNKLKLPKRSKEKHKFQKKLNEKTETVEKCKEKERVFEKLKSKETDSLIEKRTNHSNTNTNPNSNIEIIKEARTHVEIDDPAKNQSGFTKPCASDQSIVTMSTALNKKTRTPVLEKMASLVRKALSNLHDRELMTDLTIGSIDSNSIRTMRGSSSGKVPSAFKQDEGTCTKNSIISSLAGKASMRRGSGAKKNNKNKLDVQTVPVRTRTVGTNVHPQDLPRRRSGHLYLVRYHGLRVTVDEKGLEDLKKLGKERVCVPKLKTDGVKTNGDVCEGLKMRFKADKNNVDERKDLMSVAKGRERRLKVDYKPHAFSHIFKFDVMPERGDIHKRKSTKMAEQGENNSTNNKASLKLLLKKKDVKKNEVPQPSKSFGWSISHVDSLGKIEKKRKPKKSPLTLIVSPVKKSNTQEIVGKKSAPENFTEKEKGKEFVDVVWEEEVEPCEEIGSPPPPPSCWSPTESKVYEELKPLETLNDVPVEDGWLPFSFALDHIVTEDHFDQLKMDVGEDVGEDAVKLNQSCSRDDRGEKTVLIHRSVNFSPEDSDLFSNSSADVVQVDEKDDGSVPSPVAWEAEHKDVSVSIDLSDDDFCMQSDDERETKARETREVDDELVLEDEIGQDSSLMMSDLSEEENSRMSLAEKTVAVKTMSVSSQDLFLDTCDDGFNDLCTIADQPTQEAEGRSEDEDEANSDQSDTLTLMNSDVDDDYDDQNRDIESRSESLPPTTPDNNKTLGIESFYGDETPETPTLMNTRNSETPTNGEPVGKKIHTWHLPPPSRKDVEESMKSDVCKHTEAHFSRAEDGRSETLANFSSKFGNDGLDNWRAVLCAALTDDSCKDILEEMKTNPRMKVALLSNRRVIITPNLKPPNRSEVEEWARANKNDGENTSFGVCSPVMCEKPPQHSTPHGRHVMPVFSPAFTPILKKRKRCELGEEEPEVGNKKSRLDEVIGEYENEELNFSVDKNSKRKLQHAKWKKHSGQLSGRMSPLISRHLKEQRPHSSTMSNSQISCPSLANSHGFKVSYENLRDAKSVHEHQFLTVISLELHTRTRRNLRPDPNYDSICAVTYSIHNDVPENKAFNREEIGCITVCKDQTNVTDKCTCNKDVSLPGLWKCSSCQQLKRHLAARTGIVNIKTAFVSNELQLIEEVVELVRKWDPDILVGYELETSSWGFLLQRARFLKLDLESSLSRIPKLKSDENLIPVNEADNRMEELQIKGRIVLNLWHLMKREVALTSYRFENVAYHILHQRIPLYSFRNLSDWFDHQTDLYRWRTIEHYIVRCHSNIRMLMQVDFIGRTSELARLFGIQFYEVLSRGSQFRVESMMLRLAKPLNYVAVSPSVQQRAKSRASQCLPLILEPESKFYSNPVLVLDFQSLYPSMIIAYNYCYSTCLGHVDSLKETELFNFGCTSLRLSPAELKILSDGSNLNISPTGNVFVKSNIRKGVIPQMLEEILETRLMVKKAMKDYKNNKSLTKILDARQLGLKLIANVTYGYTGANYSGRMPCSEVADSVLGKARETLERAIQMVNTHPNWDARVVYGDTDSLFVYLPGRSKSAAFKIGQEIADAVTAENPKPVKLKFEKVYLPCVLETKKRYVGFMYENPDQEEPVFDAKGIETVRRDGCPAVVKVLEKSLRLLFTTRDLSRVKSYVQRQFQKILTGRVSLQDFTLAREYRGRNGYKPSACVPALEIAKRLAQEDPRAEPLAGDRVPYVIVYGSPGAPLFQLVRRPEEVLLDSNLRINAHYYVNNLLIPSLQRVFELLEVNVKQWFTTMSRINNHKLISGAEKWCSPRKGTISQYFSPMNCPGCGDTNSNVLCAKCREDPQTVVVSLSGQIQTLERNYHHLTNICASCTGSREKMSCISLDCPVFYSLAQASKDLNQVHYLRKNIDFLLDF